MRSGREYGVQLESCTIRILEFQSVYSHQALKSAILQKARAPTEHTMHEQHPYLSCYPPTESAAPVSSVQFWFGCGVHTAELTGPIDPGRNAHATAFDANQYLNL